MASAAHVPAYQEPKPSPALERAVVQVEKTFPGSTTTYTQTASGQDGDPPCPKCGSRMWDNRGTPEKPKANPKAPDFKCRDKSCDGVIWPPRGPRKQERMAVVEPTMPVGPDEEIPY